MKTKPISIIMIIIGIVIISYTGYIELRSEKTEISIGNDVKIENSESDQWSTYIGLVLLIGGIIILVRSVRKPVNKGQV